MALPCFEVHRMSAAEGRHWLSIRTVRTLHRDALTIRRRCNGSLTQRTVITDRRAGVRA